jgi:hypothetical protein
VSPAVVDAGVARLLGADAARWFAAAVAWRALARIDGDRADEATREAGGLPAFWAGPAAAAAEARLGRLRGRIDVGRVAWWAADQVLCEFGGEVGRARALLAAGAVDAAVAVAARADAVAAHALTALAAQLAEPPGPLPPMPAPDAPPARVHAWWAALTAGQQAAVVAAFPEVVGRLDGVPAAARDRANRLVLERELARVERTLAGAGGEHPRLERLRDRLRAIADRLAAGDGPRAYLLTLDPAGDGRAVIAVGDPDAADRVLTFVPGMTSDLGSVVDDLGHAGRVGARAGQLDPQCRTASVLWLDYDAPDFLFDASSRHAAEVAAGPLARFQDGLRATHDGTPPRLTVLGHSYGSVVVGAAAAQGGLAADALVFIGSPGVGVPDAGHLHAREVWSSTSRSDPIQYAALGPHALVRDVALAQAFPGIGLLRGFGHPADDLWFGPNPSGPAFGAHVFTTQPGAGHSGYWATGSLGLDTLARITLGGPDEAGVR